MQEEQFTWNRTWLTESQIQVLEKAYELIKVNKNWCTKAHAKDWRGNTCNPKSPDAMQWSASGAIEMFSESRDDMRLVELSVSEHTPGFRGINWINNHDGHAELLRVMNGTIEEQRAHLKAVQD